MKIYGKIKSDKAEKKQGGDGFLEIEITMDGEVVAEMRITDKSRYKWHLYLKTAKGISRDVILKGKIF
jgi:hypothetical protein